MRVRTNHSINLFILPVALVAAASLSARAFDTGWIAANQPLSASSLKGNLDEIQARLASLEASATTYPVVDTGVTSCGSAPATLAFPINGTVTGSGAFGRILMTNLGQVSANVTLPLPTNCGATSSPNYCYGPVTYFLNNPNAARTISLSVFLDNGPSYVYVDGNQGPHAFRSPAIVGATTQAVDVTIPQGPFALSFVACSTDGPSMYYAVASQFITANGLTVDYDRTYHRNGQ